MIINIRDSRKCVVLHFGGVTKSRLDGDKRGREIIFPERGIASCYRDFYKKLYLRAKGLTIHWLGYIVPDTRAEGPDG